MYDDPGRKGDYRVPVDRLLATRRQEESVDMEEWAKDLAFSSDLPKCYGHDPRRFATFARQYRRELAGDPAAPIVGRVCQIAVEGQLTLLTVTRDLEPSGAMVPRKRNGGGR